MCYASYNAELKVYVRMRRRRGPDEVVPVILWSRKCKPLGDSIKGRSKAKNNAESDTEWKSVGSQTRYLSQTASRFDQDSIENLG